MYRFVLPLVIFISCSENSAEEVSVENITPADSALFPEVDSNLTEPDTLAPENLVGIAFTYSGSYCGGAYPSDEILEEVSRPQPLSEMKIVLKSDYEFTFETDAEGKISAPLDPGKYKLFLDRGNDTETSPFNVNCEAYYKKEWGTVRIDSTRTDYKVHIEFPCDLCDENVKKRP